MAAPFGRPGTRAPQSVSGAARRERGSADGHVNSRPMKVEVKQVEPADARVDLVVVGLLEGGERPAPIGAAAGADAVKSGFKKLALLRPDDFPPVLVVGLGERDELDA